MGRQRVGFLEGRGAALLLLSLFVAGGLIFVFAGTLARATELEAEAAEARADIAALEQSVEAGLAEIEFIETETFVNQAARAVGYGADGETAFRLPADAPPPDPLPMLGVDPDVSSTLTPLEAWVELLFGS